MGRKHGPCFHCKIHITPLWRNGPEDKPVLCNACGSRYRKCGSLENYLPNHFQPEYPDNLKMLKRRKTLKGGKGRYLCSPKIPTRKRSPLVRKKITPMKRFYMQLQNMWEDYGNSNESSSEEVLIFNNVNNFIPSNEIGLGCIPLKLDDASA
uniref:GATA-type domain-containing protein n=1 Tax=Glycine max TaxID=3847 RepID=K7KQQ3_SOYBN